MRKGCLLSYIYNTCCSSGYEVLLFSIVKQVIFLSFAVFIKFLCFLTKNLLCERLQPNSPWLESWPLWRYPPKSRLRILECNTRTFFWCRRRFRCRENGWCWPFPPFLQRRRVQLLEGWAWRPTFSQPRRWSHSTGTLWCKWVRLGPSKHRKLGHLQSTAWSESNATPTSNGNQWKRDWRLFSLKDLVSLSTNPR